MWSQLRHWFVFIVNKEKNIKGFTASLISSVIKLFVYTPMGSVLVG
jgi:hypothetical protein